MILAEMGSDVVKVEDPDEGDETRAWPPILDGGVSGYFASLNRGKRSLTLNLKHTEARRIALELVAWADVLVENFTPGVAARLELDYVTVANNNPRLIYCSISGFGQTGPYRELRGYDPTLQAMGGLMGLTGEKGGGPVKSMVPIADLSAASWSLNAILAALYQRERSGTGQYIDMSMLDVMVSMLTTVGTAYLNTGIVPARSGTENPARTPSAAFVCSDGAYVQTAPNQRQWPRFCRVLGAEALATDPRYVDNLMRIRNQEQLYATLRDIFRRRPCSDWLAALQAEGIPAAPILTLDRLFVDPQVMSRELILEYEDPQGAHIRGLNLPFKMTGATVGFRAPSPALGEHTQSILAQFGHSDHEIARLREEGAV